MVRRERDNDRITEQIDALFGLPTDIETDEMGQLVLGSSPKLLTDPFDPDNPIEHSANHQNCPACMGADSALQGIKTSFARMTFKEAAARWMLLRRQSMSLHERTHETTQDYINALTRFFAALRLCDITPGHIRGYQMARMHNLVKSGGKDLSPWRHPAGHSLVNHEISVLAQMLRHCRLWERIRPFYFPLSVKSWSPRMILTEEEEERLFEIAARHPEASLAYQVAVITNNTSASGIELRGLRLKHLFLPENGIAEIYIPEDSVKNTSRPRKLPLNREARWAVEELLKRALKLGSCEPEHYLFPFQVRRNRYDPARPPSRWFLRKSWDKLRKATGFKELKPHDLRHHCITRLLESDVNPETVIAIAGHVNRKMLEYYAHQRTRVKYAAVCAIETRKKNTLQGD